MVFESITYFAGFELLFNTGNIINEFVRSVRFWQKFIGVLQSNAANTVLDNFIPISYS